MAVTTHPGGTVHHQHVAELLGVVRVQHVTFPHGDSSPAGPIETDRVELLPDQLQRVQLLPLLVRQCSTCRAVEHALSPVAGLTSHCTHWSRTGGTYLLYWVVVEVKRLSGGSSLVFMLDELSPVPYHAQLSDILREQIRAGDITHRVPSLTTLSQQYEVSRNTVIHALTTLESEGLIVTVQGRGTYVKP